jgi:hypothetical protein
MTDVTTDQHVNGTAPAPPASEDAPCLDCATNGEKLLAVLAIAFAVGLALMGIDMFTGGKLSGMVPERATRE